MRHHFGVTILSIVIVLLSTPSALHAQARSQVQGFGGFTFGDTSAASTFGGNVAFELTDNILIVGEAGRLSDIKPSLLDSILDFTPVDLRLSAWYGEAGVRFSASSSAIRPYAEATAGFARMHAGLSGINGLPGSVIDSALGFLDRTEPLMGVGGGVIVQGGPLVLDLGYRYKKILADNSLQSLLNGGDDFDVSQVRVGVGVRF
jgi:opacity protein-like surface antigen